MLALVGSGEYLPPMQPVDSRLLGFLSGEVRVICLPTAAGLEGPERVRYWMEQGIAHFTRLGVQVEALPLIDRAGANNQEYAAILRESNFIYLSGGRPDHLVKSLQETPAWEAILEVHQNGGVVAGCSAGAMIMGDRVPGAMRWIRAFGLLPEVVVVPHFDEIPAAMVRLIRILSPRKLSLIGIEGDTALKVDKESWEVIGSGGVTIWNHAGKKRHLQGSIC